MFELISKNKNNRLYSVDNSSISSIERSMGIIIPTSLKRLYEEIGYGFLETKYHNINRILGPSSLEEFRLKKGQFEFSEEAEELSEYSGDKLVFFEVDESLYISIGFISNNSGKIYYYDEIIANSLEEFLSKYVEDEKYFIK